MDKLWHSCQWWFRYKVVHIVIYSFIRRFSGGSGSEFNLSEYVRSCMSGWPQLHWPCSGAPTVANPCGYKNSTGRLVLGPKRDLPFFPHLHFEQRPALFSSSLSLSPLPAHCVHSLYFPLSWCQNKLGIIEKTCSSHSPQWPIIGSTVEEYCEAMNSNEMHPKTKATRN